MNFSPHAQIHFRVWNKKRGLELRFTLVLVWERVHHVKLYPNSAGVQEDVGEAVALFRLSDTFST